MHSIDCEKDADFQVSDWTSLIPVGVMKSTWGERVCLADRLYSPLSWEAKLEIRGRN